MIKLRLRHHTFIPFGSFSKRHTWIGQQWNSDSKKWINRTNEYDTAGDAELMLFRNCFDDQFEFHSTFED